MILSGSNNETTAQVCDTREDRNLAAGIEELPLSERHLAELRKSGLPDAIIASAGLRSTKGEAIRDVLGWSPKSGIWGDAILFPYHDADGNETQFARVKPDWPRHDENGRPVKYESPTKSGSRAYFPPEFRASFNAATTVIITEGEKKTLAVASAGFCCIGLGGVWSGEIKRPRNDRGKPYGVRRLLPELAALDWKGKTAVIVFDSDVADRSELQLAEYRLCELLKERGAAVLVARLPVVGDGSSKTGVDDFLVHHGEDGPARLAEVIQAAVAPVLPDKSTAMDFAHWILDAEFTTKSGTTMRRYRGQFWRYDGRRYVVLSDEELVGGVLRWLDDRNLGADPYNATKIVKCLMALTAVSDAKSMPCWLDGERNGDGWVSFDNGLYAIADPTNIRMLPHSAKYFTAWTLPYCFDPTAKCPTWLAFLNEALDGDAERIDLLQRIFGLLLTTDTSFQKVFLFVGPPRAGKGVVCRAIVAMVGAENAATPTLSGLATRFGLSSLLDASVALLPDAHLTKNTDGVRVAEILKSVSGEDPQDVDRKNLPILRGVRLPIRFVVTCNELATFTDPSGGLAKRLVVVPFFNTFLGREDRALEVRIKQELPGIMNWAIVGLARLNAKGQFNEPDRAASIKDAFRRLASPTDAFLEECAEIHAKVECPCDDVFHAWVGWCHESGHKAGSKARMGERIRAVHPKVERERKRQGGTRPYHYVGMTLNIEGVRLAAVGLDILTRYESRSHVGAKSGPEGGTNE